MIIYNKIWLNNLLLQQQVEDEHQAGNLNIDEVNQVKEKYPVGFYMPGIVIRIGLFILTCIIVLFSSGILSLMAEATRVIESFGWPLFLGIATYVVLELMVKNKNYYRSGVDDALLWIAGGFITGGFVWMVYTIDEVGDHSLIISLFIFILSLYFTLRFIDLLMSAIACFSFLAAIYFAWQSIGSFGVATLPFIMMFAGAIVYFAALRISKNPASVYYANCLVIVQVLSLTVLYLAGNFYVVNELSFQLNNGANKPIPFSFFFWLWTMLLPFAFIARGIQKKNVILLRTGLVLVFGAVATFRYYHYILPVELALTIGGIILIAVMYSVIKYLKKDKHGFTRADINKTDILDSVKVESLITAGAFSHTPDAPAQPADRFGGGSFGGGGSSDSY